ncbi:hypothetical protein [Actinomycetospora termitidis]|uniref:Uncharacterized protein n=1 Tax=Actinomycetospora termitidis TaxID=3053470 RepID=A0ABT7MCT5_9PSEU|nr:hypothetical protein [Actinomycetospora sp. Odt1-22]MDL5158470.1 hypothetical protein [Actinomycetospora sp. Odt1-22]
MTLEAIPGLDPTCAPRRPGLPVDGRGELPDPATLSCRLHSALERAAGAGLDLELHVDAEPLPAPQARVVECARESAASVGVDLRVVA